MNLTSVPSNKTELFEELPHPYSNNYFRLYNDPTFRTDYPDSVRVSGNMLQIQHLSLEGTSDIKMTPLLVINRP